jgi:hypothetical protein
MRGGKVMKKKFDQVYQFKISLKDIKPPIWRRIQVPKTYTFWDFHVAIQDSMGWFDSHFHEFEITNPLTGLKTLIGIPEEEFADYKVLPGWKIKIADYFLRENKSANYIYDFGDNWEHKITLEKILPKENNVTYPLCVKGERACPPEDCGGTYGYEDFLKIIGDPDDEQHERMLEWIGGEFNPEHFNPNEVTFDDPAERFKIAFGK